MTHDEQAGRHVGLPVTVVVARHPAPGREAELDAWAHWIVESAEAFPGHGNLPPAEDELRRLQAEVARLTVDVPLP